MLRRALVLLWLLPLLLALAAGFVLHRPRALVDWGALRAVVLESDDWGLPGFVPDAAALVGLDREALGGTQFPDVYWRSTLESAADVDALVALLATHRGRDALPAVFQPNMILPAELPGPQSPYARPDLAEAEARALAAGVWHPELHGASHLDPARQAEILATAGPAVLEAARRGVLVFPDSHTAFELGPRRSLDAVRRSWSPLPERFRDRFGQPARSVIAPDYVWDARHEDLFRDLGLRIVQAKDHQRRKDLGGPPWLHLLRKTWDRLADRWRVRDLVYLDRNAFLETAQDPHPEEVPRRCAAEVRRAWARGEPAIVETHRVNFVQVDPEAGAEGRRLLDALLTDLDTEGPVYLSDAELAGLQRRGVGVVLRGHRWVVRNPGPAQRLAFFPPARSGAAQRWIPVPPRTTLLLSRDGLREIARTPLR